jgi:pimeloyl-ACP methyl ester carboxylesterase
LVPETSARWVAFGGSQGGQAAWAANELNANYGSDLNPLGSVSVSAPLDINGFADAAAAGQLTPAQRPALLAILASPKNQWSDFNLDDYWRGIAKQMWDVLIACKGPQVAERNALVDQLTADDLRPSSPAAVDLLRGYLQKTTLRQAQAAAPMLAIYGGQDPLVPPAWTDRALDRACRMGDVIQIDAQPDKGYDDVDTAPPFSWINDRFRGDRARDDCPAFLSRGVPTGEAS